MISIITNAKHVRICKDIYCKHNVQLSRGALSAYQDTLNNEGFCTLSSCIYVLPNNYSNPPHSPYMISK